MGNWRMSKSTGTLGRERATSTLVALAVALLACAPDTALGPPSPNGIRAPNADRKTGLVITEIIPPAQPGQQALGFATAINEAGVVAGFAGTMPSLGRTA